MAISMEMVKVLRDETGVGIMQCKKALEEASGDLEKARVILKKKSAEMVAKKADRELGAGTVVSYIHSNKTVGAIVELLCETDFVSKNEEFEALARDIAMHIVAMNPEFARESNITDKAREVATSVFAAEVEGKPEDLKEKILTGKLDAYFKDKVLEKQSFIKNGEQTIADLINSAMQKFGEKVEIGRFSRFDIADSGTQSSVC